MLKPLDKHSLYDTEKFETKWEETLSTAYEYWVNKTYCPECDSKRSKPCKCRLTNNTNKDISK